MSPALMPSVPCPIVHGWHIISHHSGCPVSSAASPLHRYLQPRVAEEYDDGVYHCAQMNHHLPHPVPEFLKGGAAGSTKYQGQETGDEKDDEGEEDKESFHVGLCSNIPKSRGGQESLLRVFHQRYEEQNHENAKDSGRDCPHNHFYVKEVEFL